MNAVPLPGAAEPPLGMRSEAEAVCPCAPFLIVYPPVPWLVLQEGGLGSDSHVNSFELCSFFPYQKTVVVSFNTDNSLISLLKSCHLRLYHLFFFLLKTPQMKGNGIRDSKQ